MWSVFFSLVLSLLQESVYYSWAFEFPYEFQNLLFKFKKKFFLILLEA